MWKMFQDSACFEHFLKPIVNLASTFQIQTRETFKDCLGHHNLVSDKAFKIKMKEFWKGLFLAIYFLYFGLQVSLMLCSLKQKEEFMLVEKHNIKIALLQVVYRYCFGFISNVLSK